MITHYLDVVFCHSFVYNHTQHENAWLFSTECFPHELCENNWSSLCRQRPTHSKKRVKMWKKKQKSKDLFVASPFINLVCRKHINILCRLFCVFFFFLLFKKYAIFLSRSFDGARRRSVNAMHSMARDKCIQWSALMWEYRRFWLAYCFRERSKLHTIMRSSNMNMLTYSSSWKNFLFFFRLEFSLLHHNLIRFNCISTFRRTLFLVYFCFVHLARNSCFQFCSFRHTMEWMAFFFFWLNRMCLCQPEIQLIYF